MKTNPLPKASLNLNGRCERFIETIKLECPNKFIVFRKKHLDYLTDEFTSYYNINRSYTERDHLPPIRVEPDEVATIPIEQIEVRKYVGGLSSQSINFSISKCRIFPTSNSHSDSYERIFCVYTFNCRLVILVNFAIFFLSYSGSSIKFDVSKTGVHKALDAEPPVASFLKLMLICGGPVNANVLLKDFSQPNSSLCLSR
ncbi:transposase [Rubinisphaera italica]|uniref:Integrase catalytic domain-containing protein n=1 Tax=Rubinisphaera italica TaxID=2527969 RepID=A0A5C5XEI8_9PLAN|nr:transposase [Rubinisphaera italica]TWT60733.1 hypothetical protein Pan54_14600 [Rubinisphaera italica]